VSDQPRPETAAQRLNNFLYAYFRTGGVIVSQTFTPGAGWQSWPRFRKTMTWSWARKLRRDGVTAVALSDGRRVADFTLAELLRGGPR